MLSTLTLALLPLLVVPVLNDMLPLTPFVPAFDVRRLNEPLVLPP